MPRTAPDNYDVIVWLLNESTAPFVNSSTSSNSLGSAANLTTVNGTVGTQALTMFDQSCPYFSAFGNYPAGASSTNNRLISATSANVNIPLTVSGWVWVRTYLNLGDNVGYILSKHYRASTTIIAPSGGLTLPQGTINVASTTGFPTTGNIYMQTSTGNQTVAYTNTTGTTFTGCTGGTGVMTNGNIVDPAWSTPFSTLDLAVWSTTDGTWRAEVTVAGTNQTILASPTDFPIPIGQWSHIGLTFDGATLKSYLNGVLAGSLATTVGGLDFGTNGLWNFGALSMGASNKEEGAIMVCDWRVANIVRPLSYFQTIYRNGVLAF